MKYENFDTLKQDISGMFTLKSTIRLYLHTVVDNNANRVMVRNLPSVSNSVIVYKGLYIRDFDKDGQEEIEDIVTNDYACYSSSSGEDDFYMQVRFFIEVLHENNKPYSLCVGTRFEVIEEPHAAGYKVSRKVNNDIIVCLQEYLKFRAHIVPYFGKEAGIFLLNHDINRQCWSSVNPILPELNDVVGWSSNPLNDSVALADEVLDEVVGEVAEDSDEDDSEDNDDEDTRM